MYIIKLITNDYNSDIAKTLKATDIVFLILGIISFILSILLGTATDEPVFIASILIFFITFAVTYLIYAIIEVVEKIDIVDSRLSHIEDGLRDIKICINNNEAKEILKLGEDMRLELLLKYSKLRKHNVITEDEFNKKKKLLL